VFDDVPIVQLGEAQVAAYLKEEPRLAPYRFHLEKSLRNKEHILPEKEQSIVAQLGLLTDTPAKVSGLLNNVEPPFPPPSGPATGSSNGLHRESNFLAVTTLARTYLLRGRWRRRNPPPMRPSRLSVLAGSGTAVKEDVTSTLSNVAPPPLLLNSTFV